MAKKSSKNAVVVAKKRPKSRLGQPIGSKTFKNSKGEKVTSQNYSPNLRGEVYCADLAWGGVVTRKGEIVAPLTASQIAYRKGYIQAQSDSAALHYFKKTGKKRVIHRA